MSSLGAQARAAELAAASAAKARQQEHDMENIPPSVATSTVPLAAYSRASSSSRNKGTKSWKPLSLEDIPSNNEESCSVNAKGTPDSRHDQQHGSHKSTTIIQYLNKAHLQSEPISVRLPGAPQTASISRVPGTVVAQPVPQRLSFQPYPIVDFQNLQYSQMQPMAVPYYPGFFTELDMANVYRQPLCPHTTTDNISPNIRNMMLPSSQVRLPNSRDDTYADQALSFNPNNSHDIVHLQEKRSPREKSDEQTRNVQHGWEVVHHSVTGVPQQDLYGVKRELSNEKLQFRNFDDKLSSTSASNAVVDLKSDNFRVEAGCMEWELPNIRQGLRIIDNEPLQARTMERQAQYDRKERMQNFVAEAKHEAMSRRGKTVLHNPDLHKAKDANKINTYSAAASQCISNNLQQPNSHFRQNSVESEDTATNDSATDSFVGPQDDLLIGFPESQDSPTPVVRKAMIKPPPGLPVPLAAIGRPKKAVETFGEYAKAKAGPHIGFDIGSNEWCCLHSFGTSERSFIRAKMQAAAKEARIDVSKARLRSPMSCDDLEDATTWFRRDARGGEEIREHLNNKALDDAKARLANIGIHHNGKRPEWFRDGLDDGQAANVLLGNAVMNLWTYVDDGITSSEQEQNFYKPGKVPEWCTEEGGMLTGIAGTGKSYFDGEKGCHRGPARVARDPRYRVGSIEKGKLRIEQEWKVNQEVYNRKK